MPKIKAAPPAFKTVSVMPKTAPLAPPVSLWGNRHSLAPTIYASTILVSAFLLFMVQPILAKVILPWFGGVASVWAVAILFFQGMLLLGYTYAYLSVRYLPQWAQSILHMMLLGGSILVMPVAPWRVWQPGTDGDPAIQILKVLLLSAGLPYFLLSTTGPLVQAWFAQSQRVAFPYRLFAVSNIGSLAALLAYPSIIEPFSSTRQQLGVWSMAYGAFALLCCGSAAHFWRYGKSAHHEADAELAPAQAPHWRDYANWTLLAFCGSALLMTVTNHLCQNVFPMPLLWILPLAVYLLTFILCFDRSGWYRPVYMRWLLPPVLVFVMDRVLDPGTVSQPVEEVCLLLVSLFVCCLFCHGELAHRKPSARHLTSFYLTVALGGSLGSIAVGLVAPRVSTWPVEFPEALVLCGLLALPALYASGWTRRTIQIALLGALALFASGLFHPFREEVIVLARNFYGSLSVRQVNISRAMLSGNTRHGMQIMLSQYQNVPTTYYGPQSGVGMVLSARTSPWRVGVVGLGAGTLAAYGKPGDSFKFYEINPLVAQLANSEFTYLRSSSAPVDIAIGDGRLLLNREASGQFHLLAIDAFSGDSIPTHLLTFEAFKLYFRVMKPGGILAVHITNAFLDLKPVLAKAASELKVPAVWVHSERGDTLGADPSDWVLMSADSGALTELTQSKGTPLVSSASFHLWTDDYDHLLQLLK
jgi:hypothetical protein